MDGSLIGALRVTLGIDTAVFEEGLGIAQKRLNAAGKRFQQYQMMKKTTTGMTATTYQNFTNQSETSTTMLVSHGKSAPKLVNTVLNDGITNHMMMATTTVATTITMAG